MRKKGLTQILSFVLAASMVASSAVPAAAYAAGDSGAAEKAIANEDAAEKEQDFVTTEKADRVLADGVSDIWVQDETTVKGSDSINEVTKDGWLHLKAGTGNDNGAFPAVFVNPNTFDFTKEGYLEFDMKSAAAAKDTRFGVYLGYQSPANAMFFGYDSGGWFWQKRSDDWYTGGRTAAPAADTQVHVKISWTADAKMTLAIDGKQVFTDEDCSSVDYTSGKIAIKCSTWGTAQTEVYLKNIHYTGQAEVASYVVSGKVVDGSGAPVAGVKVAVDGEERITDADGKYSFELPDGNYVFRVFGAGYEPAEKQVLVNGAAAAVEDIVLTEKAAVATKTLSTEEMDVLVGEKFPFVVQYNMKGELEGKTFYGQTESIDTIKVNGKAIQVTEENLKTSFTSDTATYEMTLKNNDNESAPIDCVITAELRAEKNTVAFNITKVVNNLSEKDENGYEIYPVQTIEIPNHSLISVRSSQEGANLKGAKVSSNTLISGDKSYDVTDDMTFASEDFMYGFVSNNELSAGLWSNSEYEGTNVAAYVGSGGASNTRVMATTTDLGNVKSVGLASTAWYYNRKVSPTVNGTKRDYVVEHGEMPSAKVAIAGDLNEDNEISWQDGAIAFREIMNNPLKSEEVPDLMNYRIVLNFASQATNPFLTTLDGVKRVYLNTDGLGQGVLLKGYGSEGHDSGHPDYGDIGTRIGGAEDMNTLMTEGKKMGALFGVHINASEMYTEAKAFNDELSRGNYGWNWLDQGIGINGLYDLASGSRISRLQKLYDQVGNNLDFIYLDVWGNNTSGSEDSWESRNIARQINSFGWRFTTEWGATQEYDSTLQHWAADLAYGGAGAKGQNSEVMRFLRNHQKDSWIADYPSYNGAAQAPLLGGLNMTDFEGWQSRIDYNNYIKVMFRHNLITKFLQHYQVVKWVDGTPVTMSGRSWTPEMEITLKNTRDHQDDTTIQVTRKSNDVSDLAKYRSRTITLDGVTISTGAPTGGDGSHPGNETYLIPWNWGVHGEELDADDQKLYHWNTQGGTTTWTLTKNWQNLKNVVVYRLSDEGRSEKTVVPVVDGQITLENMEAEVPYVIYKGEKEPLKVSWQSSKYIYDMGFNDPDVTANRTIEGDGTAQIVDTASSANNMLKLEGEVAVTTELTNLKPGQKYAVYIGVDNRSEVKARMTVKADGKVLAANYTEKSFVNNMVGSDAHHMGSGATVTGSNTSYFQNMYVFFTAPETGKTTLTLSHEAGEGAVYFDDVRVVETEMDVVQETDEEGTITSLYNDFEHNAQGLWPFVLSGPGQGYAGWVTDGRVHLSEANGKYTNAGYKDKKVDDVLDGNWSLKINGLTQQNSIIYQTLPQNFHFNPGETYYVSFDYQLGSEGTYEVRLGDGDDANVASYGMPAAIGTTKNYGFSFTAGESGQNWFGIYSTGSEADLQGMTNGGSQNFSGYRDFIMDNIRIEKGGMLISDTRIETTTASKKFPLNVTFIEPADKDNKVTWASSDENVAYVDQNGVVSFTGYGSAMITATAKVGGKEQTLCCSVKLIKDYEKVATFEETWCNTEELSGEDGGSYNIADRNSSTIWTAEWSGTLFEVSESNPAIVTAKLKEDVTEFANVAFRQRGGSVNGLVLKYEVIVGDSYNEDTGVIEDGVSTGVVTAKMNRNGEIETITLPEGAKGHYIQIRVLEGKNGFAAIADILLDTVNTYETPVEKVYLRNNKIEALNIQKAEEKAVLNSETATNEEKAAAEADIKQLNREIRDALAEIADQEVLLKAGYEAILADEKATEEEKTAAKVALDQIAEYMKGIRVYLEAMDTVVKADELIADLKDELQAAEENAASLREDLEKVKAELDQVNAELTETIAARDNALDELEKAKAENGELSEKAAQLQSKVNELNGQISDLTTQKKNLQAQYDEKAKLLAEAEADLKKVNDELAALRTDKVNLEAQLKQLQNEKDKAEQNANDKQKELDQAKKDIEALKKALEEAQKQLNALNNNQTTLKKGDLVVYKNVTYTVLDPVKKTAAATKGKNAAAIIVAKNVQINGVTCKVTQILAKAFQNAKKLKKVVIGANVQKIGARAFYNAKKLRTVNIKSKKLKSVGSKAFTKICAKAKISVPKTKKAAYKKLLKKKVPSKTVIK